MKYRYLLMIAIAQLFKGYWKTNPFAIYAMAKHETGNFTSNIFKENKNFFGMKQSRSGAPETNYEVGTARGHAKYTSLWHAIFDFFGRQNYFKISGGTTEEYFRNTVNSGYAEDPNYLKKWLRHYDEIKKSKGSVIKWILIIIIPLGVVIYLGYRGIKKLFKWQRR